LCGFQGQLSHRRLYYDSFYYPWYPIVGPVVSGFGFGHVGGFGHGGSARGGFGGHAGVGGHVGSVGHAGGGGHVVGRR